MIPKINSSHGSETRNIINAAIDSINAQGKSIQDLVAEGQLTSEQYAQLITVINGHLKSGDVSLYDIDFNLKKIGLEHLSEEVKKSLTGETPILSEVADGAVSEVKILDKAVSPRKSNFFVSSKNLATEIFEEWTMLNVAGSWLIQKETSGYFGSMQFVKIQPNTNYTIKIHEPSKANRFKVATSATSPSFNESGQFNSINILKSDDVIKDFTFTSETNHNYLYVYVSNASQRPKLQIEEGAVATPYIPHFILPDNLIYPSIDDRYIKVDNTVTVVEDFKEGYKKRPNATSVIWIGPNEPIEAEPFDEWRETDGYTLFEDFESYKVRDTPFPTIWGNPQKNSIEGDTSKHLVLRGANTGIVALKWLEVESGDVEIYARVNAHSSAYGGQKLSFLLKGSGTTGNEKGYAIGVRGEPGVGDLITINRIVSGSSTSLLRGHPEIDFSKDFKMIARIDVNRIRVKVWEHDKPEPKEWTMDYTDLNPITDGNIVGLYSYYNNDNKIYEIGLGTGGMKAPKRQLIL